MKRMAQFLKVSPHIFQEAVEESFPQYTQSQIQEIYAGIPLPRRATRGSAGYDFFAPFSFSLAPGATIKIPTGIRVRMDEEIGRASCRERV